MPEVLRGNADHCDMSVVLQLISAQWLTGRLAVESDLTIEATVDCIEGLPIGARCGDRTGLEAFYEAFLVPQRHLVFHVQDVVSRPPLGEVMVLLLEACRRLDEWRTLSDRAFHRSEGADVDPGELAPLWEALDGVRTVRGLATELRLVRATIVDPLRAWIDQGAVTSAEGLAAPPAAPVSVPDTAAVLARGRAQVRDGDIVGAIASFREAMAIDPHHLLARQHLLRLRQLHPHLFDEET